MALGKPNGLQNKTKSHESEKKMDKKEWVLIKMEERKGRVIKDHQFIYVENYQRANVIANKIIGSEIPVICLHLCFHLLPVAVTEHQSLGNLQGIGIYLACDSRDWKPKNMVPPSSVCHSAAM